MDGSFTHGNQTPRGVGTKTAAGGSAFSIMFDKPRSSQSSGSLLTARGNNSNVPLSARRKAQSDHSLLHHDDRPSKKASFKFLKKDAGHKAYDAHADASMTSEGAIPHRTSSAILESRALREAMAADMRDGKAKDPFADVVIAVPKRGPLSKEEQQAIVESQEAAAEAAKIVAAGGTLPPPPSRKPAPKVKKLNIKPAWNDDLPAVESQQPLSGQSPMKHIDPIPAQQRGAAHSQQQQPPSAASTRPHKQQQQPPSGAIKKTSVLDDYDGGQDSYDFGGGVENDDGEDEPWREDEDEDVGAHDEGGSYEDYDQEDEAVPTLPSRNSELMQTIRPVTRTERHRQARAARGEAEPEGYESDEGDEVVEEDEDGHLYQRAPNSARVRFEVNQETAASSGPLSRTAPPNSGSGTSTNSSRQQQPPPAAARGSGSSGSLRSNNVLGSSTTAGQSPSSRNRNFFGQSSPEASNAKPARPQTAHPSRRPHSANNRTTDDYGGDVDDEEFEEEDDYYRDDTNYGDEDDDAEFYGSSSQQHRGQAPRQRGPANVSARRQPPSSNPSPLRGVRSGAIGGGSHVDDVQGELLKALEEERESTRLERLECQRTRMNLDKERERFRRQKQQEEEKLHMDREELERKIEDESRVAKRDQRAAEERAKGLRADLQTEKENGRRLRDENDGLREQLDKALSQMRQMEKKHRFEAEKMRVDVAALTARNAELMDMTKASQTALLQAQQQQLQQQALNASGGGSGRFRDPHSAALTAGATAATKSSFRQTSTKAAPVAPAYQDYLGDDNEDEATLDAPYDEETEEAVGEDVYGSSRHLTRRGGAGRASDDDTGGWSSVDDEGNDPVLTKKASAAAEAARQQTRERRAREIEKRLEREEKERKERREVAQQKREEERERKELALQQQQDEAEEKKYRDQMAAAAKSRLKPGSNNGSSTRLTQQSESTSSTADLLAASRPPIAPSNPASGAPPRGLPRTIPTNEELVYDGEPDAEENIPEDCVTSQRLTGAGNNKKEITYRSGKREVHYSNNTIKTVLPSGHTILRFSNGDIKTTYPSGKSTYWYDSAQTTHTQLSNGIEIFQFHSTQQTERHYPNGTKEILYPEGIYKLMRVDGTEESMFPDGTTHRS